MSIGPDINDVLDELGILAVIVREPANLSEKITYDVNEQITNQFIREFQLNASFRYNTVIVCGDLLQFNNLTYLVVHKTPDSFENEIVENVGVLFKCNLTVNAKLLSYVESINQETFEVTSSWSIKKDNIYGLLHDNISGAIFDASANTGKEITYKLECIVPASYSTNRLDRIYLSDNEYYRVEYVEKHQLPGCHVLTLVEDDRIVYTSPSTSPSSSPTTSPSPSTSPSSSPSVS